MPGFVSASWITRTPDVRDLLGASTAEMGFILLGLSAGSMIGVLCSGPLVIALGSKKVVTLGMPLVALSMPVIGFGTLLHGWVVAAGLACFGLGMGLSEVALNVQGTELERSLRRSIMPSLHAFYSLGTVVGGISGMVATAISVPVFAHLFAVFVLVTIALAVALRFVSSADSTDKESSTEAKEKSAWSQVLRDPVTLLLGAVVLALALAEGSANDWLPLIIVDSHHAYAALGSAVFVIFAAAMTIARFAGNALVNKFGPVPMLVVSCVMAILGVGTIILADSLALAMAAVVLWGLGAALGFPVALSVAGESPENAAAKVSLAATLGYIAFLAGPPTLGLLGEKYGLRMAMIVVFVALILGTVAATQIRRAARRVSDYSTTNVNS